MMLILIILLPVTVLAYDTSCPDHSQKQLRSRGLCLDTKSVYTCLENGNTPTSSFIESCSEKEDVVRSGKRYIVKGQSTTGKCSTDRYQPIPFYKTSGSMCLYLESKCSEVGQIIARKGSGIADTTCICDFKQGYAYVTRPHDVCNCVPSQEDCSCYVKQCPENGLLSAANECKHINTTSRNKFATVDRTKKTVTTTTTTLSRDLTAFNESPTRVRYAAICVTVIIGIIIIGLISTYILDKFDCNPMLSDEWQATEDTGELENTPIVKSFDKEAEYDFSRHCGHLLNAKEITGIVVKFTTLVENGQRKGLPTDSMISEKVSFTDVINRFNVKTGYFTRTPWLCIEFDVMPFDFFNHIVCYYISKYAICTEPQTNRQAVYHGMGVFCLDSKLTKFILCFCENTIALQIWQWRKMEKGKFKAMRDELKALIERVKDSFETTKVSYTVKSKCSDGNIRISAGRHSYSELVELGDDYFCEEHSDSHNIQDFLQTWFEDHTENEYDVPSMLKMRSGEGIQDTRFKQKRHVCDNESSIYWCHGCQRSMCVDCSNQHRETSTKFKIVQHVQYMYSQDYNFKVDVGLIQDIKVLHDDMLVIADNRGKKLLICDITGQQQHTIPLPGGPWNIAVVDNNTVAVTLDTTAAVVIDVRQRQVTQHTDLNIWCCGIMYRDNQLFAGCRDRTIKVMNMSGEVTHTIPVGVIPWYICGGVAGRIYYTDYKLYCIDTVGKTLFTFTDPNMSGPQGITTDDEGHVLVLCRESNNVLRISPDGKHGQVIITQILSSDRNLSWICYISLSKSVVIGDNKKVYVYKKI